MHNSSQTEIQKWEDVNHYTKNIFCHICNGTEKVKTGKIPDETIDFSISKRLLVGVALWQLCEKCHYDGWDPPSNKFLGKFSYFKIYGDSVKVLTI